jgi:hypothetical protein
VVQPLLRELAAAIWCPINYVINKNEETRTNIGILLLISSVMQIPKYMTTIFTGPFSSSPCYSTVNGRAEKRNKEYLARPKTANGIAEGGWKNSCVKMAHVVWRPQD